MMAHLFGEIIKSTSVVNGIEYKGNLHVVNVDDNYLLVSIQTRRHPHKNDFLYCLVCCPISKLD